MIPLLTLLFSLSAAAAPADTACLQCHGSMPGRLGAPVEAWKQSVHAANGISCHDCHGGDPTDPANAMSPDRGFLGKPDATGVPDFCGRCHVGVADDYEASLHGKALGAGGPNCVTCHGNHGVQRASLAIIDEQRCGACHTPERAMKIKAALQATDDRIGALEAELEPLHRQAFDVEDMKGELFQARNDFHRLFHTVQVSRVEAGTGAVGEKLDAVQASIDEVHAEVGRRHRWGGLVVGLFVLMGLFGVALRRSLHAEE